MDVYDFLTKNRQKGVLSVLKEIIQNNRFSFQKGFSSWEDAIRTACHHC